MVFRKQRGSANWNAPVGHDELAGALVVQVDAAALAMQVGLALCPFAIDSVRSNGIVSDWNRLAYLLQLLGLAVIASEYLPQRVPQDTARSGKGLKGDKEG
jgi:hypothetical protein